MLAAVACGAPPGPPAVGVVVVPDGGGREAPDAVLGDPVRLTYLGSGGWIFEYQGEQLLAAPLFSNPGFLETGLSRISSDTAAVDEQMAPFDVGSARAILVGHAHYDHLMDVPRVAERHAPRARILGSGTVRNMLGMWSGVMGRVDLVTDSAGDARTPGRWMRYGPRIRVMPLRSLHGPHFDGLTLYVGTTDEPRAVPPHTATEWVDGETFAFLVDFLDDDGEVAFRIYYQDAVAPAPLGFAPPSVLEEHVVDVAILVPATFEEVRWHPEAIVENLQPRSILLGHWEDFFQPYDRPVEPVPLTDLAEFERRLARVYDGPVWRPDRFTEFLFAPGDDGG